MEYINNGDGDPEQARLPVWLQYSANQSHPNHVVSMMCPMVIIDRDYDYIESCLEILKSRVYKEHHPSPTTTPGTTPPPTGRPTTITSPKAPTPPPPTSPVWSRASDQQSRASDTLRRHLEASLVAAQQRTAVELKEAELKEAREELT